MKIAQISPLFESVPPKLYGGTERVVSFLTEELVSMGHDVTLFASGDSITRARLCGHGSRALRLAEKTCDQLIHHYLLLEKVFSRAAEFDVLHFHVDYLHFPFSRRQGFPQLTTLHGRLDLPELTPLYQEYCDMPLVSISHAQRQPLANANWLATVYHGLPEINYSFHPGPGEYLAFLGRISPEKRLDRAIEIAVRSHLPLRIAAKVDPVDRQYFESSIRPLLAHPLVDYLGEIGDGDKADFLGRAIALLFPIDWQEPFGLVMIEAMACGTPVIAWRLGSVPEVMREGVSGYIVDNLEAAVQAVGKAALLSRSECRRYYEERFTARRMAKDYLAAYRRVLAGSHHTKRLAN